MQGRGRLDSEHLHTLGVIMKWHTPGAKAIDRGKADVVVPPDDLEGETRPDALGPPDIGHDEYTP